MRSQAHIDFVSTHCGWLLCALRLRQEESDAWDLESASTPARKLCSMMVGRASRAECSRHAVRVGSACRHAASAIRDREGCDQEQQDLGLFSSKKDGRSVKNNQELIKVMECSKSFSSSFPTDYKFE